jgi:hypothetical protein
MKYKDVKDKKVPFSIDLSTPDSGYIKCPCSGERFQNIDLLTPGKMLGLRFREFSGWIILDKLVRIILYYRPYCVVEVGMGESTRVLAKICEDFNVPLYCCDIKEEKQIKHFSLQENHLMRSEDFFDVFDEKDENPAVVFIDADHHYDAAKMEFDYFFDKLVPGGVIFLHDTMPPHEEHLRGSACGDVYRLRQELEKRTDEMDCFTWPYTATYSGLTMVLKKEEDRPYWEA